MLNPGLSALWEEEKRRRDSLNIKTPLDVVDDEGFNYDNYDKKNL